MKTFVKDTRLKGRGVFAATDIKKNELIETCHLILMDLNDVQGALESYVYEYTPKTAAIALGHGSLYNHSDEANSEFDFDYKKKLLKVRAKKLIIKGSEITVDYGYSEDEKKRFGICSN